MCLAYLMTRIRGFGCGTASSHLRRGSDVYLNHRRQLRNGQSICESDQSLQPN